jgi:integrase
MPFDPSLALPKINARLKGTGLQLELIGKANAIYIRGTFPNEPWKALGRSQRRLALKTKALDLESLRAAENRAREIALDLNKGSFNWNEFLGKTEERKTIAYYCKLLEQDKYKSGRVSDYTWKYSYEKLIETLPLKSDPSEEILMAWVLEQDPKCTTMRPKYLSVAASICEYADIDCKRLKRLRREYSSKPINDRNLPSDELIEQTWESINSVEWKAVYGMLATYGFRPHELFHLSFDNWPNVNVLEDTKTGARLVPPIHAHWIEKFSLSERFKMPSNMRIKEGTPNATLGKKIASGFTHLKLSDPYNLRHCYARRCLVLGLPADISAKLLGHSQQIHLETYRRFVTQNTYVDIANSILKR